MNTTDTTKLHPLHALYLGRNHGEVGTVALPGRPALAEVATKDGSVATGQGAGVLAVGLGLVAAAAVAELTGKPTSGK